MAVQEIVRRLTEYVRDDGETIRRRDGPQAVTLIEDLRDVLVVHLREESPYSELWDEFRSDPEDTSAELTGALEALVEAEPALAKRMDGFMERYRRLSAAPRVAPLRSAEDDLTVAGKPLETTVTVEDTSVDVPHTPTAPADAGIGEGTYLYGNMESGTPSVQKGIEFTGLGIRGQVIDISGRQPELNLLFDQIVSGVEARADLNSAAKDELKAALRGVESQLAAGEEIDEAALVQDLSYIHQIDPDVLDMLVSELNNMLSGLGGAVQQIVDSLDEEEA